MSLIWADNFQSYGTTQSRLLDGIYIQADTAQVSLVEDPDPLETDIVYFKKSNVTPLRYALPAGATASGGAAFRVYFAGFDASRTVTIFQYRDSAASTQVTLAMTVTGVLEAYRGSVATGVLLGTSTTPVITANSWNHIEIKALISQTLGTVEVRVNGVTKINLSAIDTAATALESYSIVQVGENAGENSALPTFYLKDYVIWNTAGTIGNNFYGQVKAVSSRPTSDVTFTWTPSTGLTGFNLVDEASTNDADFISAANPPPAASVFGLADLPADVTSVKGVIAVGRMRKTDGGDCNVQMALKSGASTGLGADRPITSAFTYWYDVSEVDPATLLPWTPTGYNAAQFQINRTL